MPGPPPPLPTAPAFAVNPEAGQHLVTGDPVALAAAFAASGRSWARFPYLQARYGARGEAFSRSDSGWLVTLAEVGPVEREGQVDWLGLLLCARGIPHLVLEHQLGELASALDAARPERTAAWEGLRQSGQRLAAARRAALDDAALEALERRWQELTAGGPAALRGLGELLGAAVADEARGLGLAVPALRRWVEESGRAFPPLGPALDATLGQARALAAGRAG